MVLGLELKIEVWVKSLLLIHHPKIVACLRARSLSVVDEDIAVFRKAVHLFLSLSSVGSCPKQMMMCNSAT